MKKSIFTMIVGLGLVMPTAAMAATDTVTQSFQRDLNHNHVQISTEARGSVDSVQQYVNSTLRPDMLVASFQRDLNRTPVKGFEIAGHGVDSFQQQVNIALRGETDPVMLSFQRDLYRTPVKTAASKGHVDTVQQWINLVLRGGTGPIIASFERGMGVTIASADESMTFDVDALGQDYPWWTNVAVTAFV